MSLTIGRVGLDVTLNNPASLSLNGDVLSMSGPFRVSSVANMKTLRQQLAGYVDNPWEKVVPVTFSTDSTVDGFYRVLDASIDVPTFGYKNGYANFDVSLERVRGYSAPVTEAVLYGTDRNGIPGGVTASTWHAVNSYAAGYNVSGAPAPQTRTGPGGTVRTYADATLFYSARPTWVLSPARWYEMAATIKVAGDPVVGRQVIGSGDAFELSNGLIKLQATSLGQVKFYPPISASPSTYGTAIQLDPSYYVSGTSLVGGSVPSSLTVLRNCPEECAIRLTYEHSISSAPVFLLVDYSLRRGSRFVNVTMSSVASAKWGMDVQVLLGTSITGGYRVTANDADGNRLVFVSAKTFSRTGDTKALYLTSAGTFHDFMVGSEVGGSGATGVDTATALRDQFFAAQSETQSVRLQ